ncbi:MAG: Hsp20/alpha crystallin family protein [Promethearchaeota archaeon]
MKKERKKGEVSPSTEKGLTTREESISRGVDSLFDDFRRSVDNLMAPFLPFGRSLYGPLERVPIRYPLCDVIDKGDEYLVRFELPGFNKDNINVELNKKQLELSAQIEQQEEKEESNYIHRERSYSRIQRTVAFPEEVDPEKVEGTMRDGILELKITKKEPKLDEKMRKIELK